jgi:hypothetical protein
MVMISAVSGDDFKSAIREGACAGARRGDVDCPAVCVLMVVEQFKEHA